MTSSVAIAAGTAASQLEDLPWTTRLWRSISETYNAQSTPSNPVVCQ
jgi:hypothetical protein